jgi:hypothetical protein
MSRDRGYNDPMRFLTCLNPIASIRSHTWLRIGLAVVMFNAVIAVLLAPLNSGEFATTLVHTQCIGLSIFGIYRLIAVVPMMRYSTRYLSQSSWSRLAWAIAMVPAGYIIGTIIAATVLGERDWVTQLLETSSVSIGVAITASVCINYFFWSRRRLSEETAAHAQAQKLAAEAQLKLLQTQIEPHMLFNTLSTLHTLIEIDPSRAQSMVEQLITYLRGTLAASRAEQITLHHEFEQLRAYLQLMSLRMGPRLSYSLQLPEPLRSITVPPMLLQPLVENAIKHGLEPKVEGGSIEVSASLCEGSLLLVVRDTGLGYQGDALDREELPPGALHQGAPPPGFGLGNVRERLRVLYGSHAAIEIISAQQPGLTVRLTLPQPNP